MLNDFILQITDTLPDASGTDAFLKVCSKIGLRLLVNLLSVWVLIRLVYYPANKKRDMFFTYFIFNTVIFLICFLLNKVELSLGAAFGLFAVFSMLRYRTEDISLKDMTYLFLVIALGLISAVTKIKGAPERTEVLLIVFINVFVIALTALLESDALMKRELVKTVMFDKIDLIHTSQQEALLEDLKNRTGLNIHRVQIQKIDFLKDAAEIKVFFTE
jgi:hypothetical protein